VEVKINFLDKEGKRIYFKDNFYRDWQKAFLIGIGNFSI
jgi:hypothetical protein